VIIGTGEPLAPRSAWRQLTEAFLQEFPEAYFYHITEEFADLLHDMGYWINGCGTETTLQVRHPLSDMRMGGCVVLTLTGLGE
jgi:lysylphosphatidylglycerol synthetase-like protein (DUF2156 family)